MSSFFAHTAQSALGSAIWRALPVVNFGIASLALTFQTTVLYPWHIQLEDDFHELKKSHEQQLSRYHEMKLERLDSIEKKLTQIVSSTAVSEPAGRKPL
jgi:hypothetical protein